MSNNIVIYYGEGQGKSTAALGNAIRKAGEGKQVIAIQFMKGRTVAEQGLIYRLEPEIKVFSFAKQDECFNMLEEEEKQEERINLKNGFNYGKKVVTTEACDMLILDEILGVIDEGIVSMDEVIELLEAKPEDMSIVLTGRVLSDKLRSYADEIYNIAPEK